MTKRHLGFWTNNTITDQKFIEWFDKQGFTNSAQATRKLWFDVMNGKLIVPTKEDLRNEKIRVDIQFKRIMIQIKEKELLYFNTFNKTPSSQGLKAIKTGLDNQLMDSDKPSCYDEKNNRIQCPECGILFVITKSLGETKSDFADHYNKKHGIIPKEIFEELTVLK